MGFNSGFKGLNTLPGDKVVCCSGKPVDLRNKSHQNAHRLNYCFDLIIVSSICFEHPSAHPQKNLYMQFYGILFMRPYKQYRVHPSTDQTVYTDS